MKGIPKIFIIKGELPGMNKVVDANRTNRYLGAKMKKEQTNFVAWQVKGRKLTPPVSICFNWYCKNERRDPDNVASAKKFILDGLVKAKVIPNDTWKNIHGFMDRFFVDKTNPRIELECYELG